MTHNLKEKISIKGGLLTTNCLESKHERERHDYIFLSFFDERSFHFSLIGNVVFTHYMQLKILFTNSSISSEFLGVSIVDVIMTGNGAQVTARLDFQAASEVKNFEIEQAFLDGLIRNMFLGSNNQVVSSWVSAPGRHKSQSLRAEEWVVCQ